MRMKKERWKSAMRMKKEWAKKREEKGRKERTKRGLLNGDVQGLFPWRLKKFLVEKEIWRVVVIFLGKTSWISRESEARVVVPIMLDVTDVLVSPSSVVTELCDGFSCCSDWEFVEPQSFSFSKKRAHSCTVSQEEIRFEEPQVKAPPLSRRRMMPPTPLQNSYSTFEEEQEHFEVEDQMWSARDRTIISKTKQYLEESKSFKRVKV